MKKIIKDHPSRYTLISSVDKYVHYFHSGGFGMLCWAPKHFTNRLWILSAKRRWLKDFPAMLMPLLSQLRVLKTFSKTKVISFGKISCLTSHSIGILSVCGLTQLFLMRLEYLKHCPRPHPVNWLKRKFVFGNLSHPPYGPSISSYNFHLFGLLKFLHQIRWRWRVKKFVQWIAVTKELCSTKDNSSTHECDRTA